MKNSGNKEVKELGIKTIFTFIVNGIFSVFFVTSGALNFKENKIIAGLLYLVLAALAVVPHRLLRVTQALKIVILIVLFVMLAGFAARGDPVAEQKYEDFNLGQKFNLEFGKNTFSMMVKSVDHDAKLSTELKEELITSGSFIIVRVEIVNLGSEAEVFKLGTNPELKDDQDRRFTLYGKALTMGNLQPGVAKEVSYVFEIPKDATELKFIVKDKTDVAKFVDLGK
ncbi:MAG: DUF4352 domain-containing protein [Patescibacteria group bacterium]